jgi:hypothetical protein
MYEEMRKYLTIYEEAVSYVGMTLQLIPSEFLYMRKILFSFLSVQAVQDLFTYSNALLSLGWC